MSCLNPLSTGKSVQTFNRAVHEDKMKVLIPYLQGSLFRLRVSLIPVEIQGLNPLSTGKSVQTIDVLDDQALHQS